MQTIFASILFFVLAAVKQAACHMDMAWPYPLLASYNPLTGDSGADYSYTSPLSSSGSDYPCKGHLSALGTAQGASVVTWSQGGQYNFTIQGGANHEGGSCQASLSYDQGKTFTVIESYIGGCPPTGTSNWDFTIPSDATTGDAVFAWTWFNNVGNREMYMNCAAVTIAGSSSKRSDNTSLETRGTAFSARPGILVANVGNGCSVPAGVDVEFPDAGPDVSTSSVAGHSTVTPSGSCGAAVAVATGSGSSASASAGAGSGSGATASTATTPAAAATSSTASTSSFTGGVFVTNSAGVGSSSTSKSATTTLSTSTATGAAGAGAGATGATGAGAGTKTTTAAAATGTGSAGTGSTTSGAYAEGTTCTNEGAWNCIDGSSFQRCASGMWSATMAMASGTTCQPGVSDTLTYTKSKKRLNRMGKRLAVRKAMAGHGW